VPVKENLDCGQVDKPIPVMIVNGTADPINPYHEFRQQNDTSPARWESSVGNCRSSVVSRRCVDADVGKVPSVFLATELSNEGIEGGREEKAETGHP